MAGNRKNNRKPVVVVHGARTKKLMLPMLNLPPPPLELKRMANIAKVNLNHIITGEAVASNWMSVLHRLYVGFFAAENFMNFTKELEEYLCDGIVMMRIVYIRSMNLGKFGIMVFELDRVMQALDVTEEIMRLLTLQENRQVHDYTAKYFDDLVTKNMESYPPEVLTKMALNKAMVETLTKEREEVERKAA